MQLPPFLRVERIPPYLSAPVVVAVLNIAIHLIFEDAAVRTPIGVITIGSYLITEATAAWWNMHRRNHGNGDPAQPAGAEQYRTTSELPPTPRPFVGRVEEIGRIEEFLRRPPPGRPDRGHRRHRQDRARAARRPPGGRRLPGRQIFCRSAGPVPSTRSSPG